VEYVLRFANASALFFLIPAVVLLVILKLKWRRRVAYNYSLAAELEKKKYASSHKYKIIFFTFRFVLLIGIALLIGRPQLVDPKSNILVEGIDMMVVLDASGSMDIADRGERDKTRFDVAKQEAIRFIEKRKNDPIGLVIFGNDSVSRCPITADKNVLTSIVKDLRIGDIDKRGTMLSTAILTAANRLKHSKSKSKIMIVLTDGEPTAGDHSPEAAAEVARRMGIKIYTIGIGSDKDSIIRHGYAMVQLPGVNRKLLTDIAEKTGGRFFLAKNRSDMRQIYNVIDALEKTEYETDIFSRYYELFMNILWILFVLVLFELFLSSTIWFGL